MRQAKSLNQQHRFEVESCAGAPRPAQAGVRVQQDPIQGGLAAEAGRPVRVIRRFEKSMRLSLLEFLLFAGDERYGALGVSLKRQTYAPWPNAPVAILADLHHIVEAVRKVLAYEPVPEPERRLIRPCVSLGDARPKSLIQIDGQSWLVKFSEGEEADVELIEHAAMTLASRCGIQVAATRALPVWPATTLLPRIALTATDLRGATPSQHGSCFVHPVTLLATRSLHSSSGAWLSQMRLHRRSRSCSAEWSSTS